MVNFLIVTQNFFLLMFYFDCIQITTLSDKFSVLKIIMGKFPVLVQFPETTDKAFFSRG